MKLNLPCNIIITGATLTGKTTVVRKLLDEQILKQMDYIYIFSQTPHLSSNWNQYKTTQVIKVSEVDMFIKTLEEIFKVQKGNVIRCRDDDSIHIPRITVILDDLINTKILSLDGYVSKMCTSSRYYNVSMIITSQRIVTIPFQVRINSDYIFAFRLSNYNELERFLVEYVPQMYRKKVAVDIEEIYSVPYNYISVDKLNSNLKERLRLNGEMFLLI